MFSIHIWKRSCFFFYFFQKRHTILFRSINKTKRVYFFFLSSLSDIIFSQLYIKKLKHLKLICTFKFKRLMRIFFVPNRTKNDIFRLNWFLFSFCVHLFIGLYANSTKQNKAKCFFVCFVLVCVVRGALMCQYWV